MEVDLDSFLAKKFKRGDQSAFKELYELYFDNAMRLAIGILRNEHTANDIVQISFLRAYDYRRSYNDRKPFSFWFNRILVNECNRYLSKNKRNDAVYTEDAAAKEQSTDDVYRFERYELLYKALQELSDDMRIPLLLKYINGYKEAEIAEVLNLKSSTVKSRLYEGRKKVKSIMLTNGYKEYRHE